MSFAEFHWLRPGWLLALLPAAVLLAMLVKNRLGRGDWSEVCDPELLPFILQDQPAPAKRGSLIGAAIAMLLTVLALAGPTWQRLPSPAFRNDSALVIALDLSKSMNATDVKPSRLARARYKIADILKQRKDGQTALLVYSGDAFTVTPLTTDTATINSQLEALTTDIMPSPGSNTTLAVEKSVELLRQASLAQGHILLVTDGADGDSAGQATGALGDYRLSVLALGTEAGAPIPLPGGGFVKDRGGAIVVARLDASALMAMAADGHGIYQPVTADDDDVARLSATFGRAEPGQSQQQADLLLQQWDEKGPWLALLVLPWAALRFRKGILSLMLLCLLPLPRDANAFDWQSLWHTPNQRAQQAFDRQQFDQAAEQFENPDWRAAAQYRAGQYQQAAETLKDAASADGHYNRGNALAKAGQLQEALQAYQQTLKLDPNHADAKYNKELIEKQLQDQQQQGDDQKSSPQQDKDQKDPQADDASGQSDSRQKSSQSQNQQDEQSQQGQQPQPADRDQGQNQPPPKPQQQDRNGHDQGEKQQAKPAEEQPEQARAAEDQPPETEADRANQQLLKRIPDEPTGLLKRKFRYQYGQRGKSAASNQDW